MKLRNAYGLMEWKGKGNEKDNVFWGDIELSEKRAKFISPSQIGNDGIFYMLYTDFLKYYSCFYLNFSELNGSYINEYLMYDQKRGLLHEV